MAMNFGNENNPLSILIEGRDLHEIDILRREAAAGQRAATFLKNALGEDAVLALIAAQAADTEHRWKQWLDASGGRFRAEIMTYRVEGMSADSFWGYVMANIGQVLQFKMHPEHYIAQFKGGATGEVVIAETWGSAMIVAYSVFTDVEALRNHGFEIDSILEMAAERRMAAIARTKDGQPLSAVLHQLIPTEGGFRFKTCSFIPEALPAEIIAGMEEHGSVEFTNLIRIACDAAF